MAKTPPQGPQYATDPDRRPQGHGRGNGKDWVDHGGRSISDGPGPGQKSGVSRSDGPDRAGSGTSRDLGGKPKAPPR